MARVLVAGLINIETTLRVDSFPLHYNPVNYPFGGVASSVSGVGLNVARALQVLGHDVRLAAMIGNDPAGQWVLGQLAAWNLPSDLVIPCLDATPQSVILYDRDGRRQIHVDLKTIQETDYPADRLADEWPHLDLAALCNINFSRALIPYAKTHACRVATDVHALADLDDVYNRDFMAAADILFMSHEHLPLSAEATIHALVERHGTPEIVIGQGKAGALLGGCAVSEPDHVSSVTTRPVVNTIGAGDALFSAYLHGRLTGRDPIAALRQAVVFASWKIGVASASNGFLDARQLEALINSGYQG